MNKQDGAHIYKGILFSVLRLVPKSSPNFLTTGTTCLSE